MKTLAQESVPEFNPTCFKRNIRKLDTQINLLKSDVALLQGEEKKIINNKIIENENKKGYLIISLRKTILDCPKGLKNFLLHTHPIAYSLSSHAPFKFTGPNFCNYITEAVVICYIHDKCVIAFGKEEGDEVSLPVLKKFLHDTLKIQLNVETVLGHNKGYLKANKLVFRTS